MFDFVTSTDRRSKRHSFHRSRRPLTPGRRRTLALTVGVLTAVTGLALASPALAGSDLTLRVNDVKAAPGSLVAVEVRTYAPRGVGQGQICLRAATRLDSSGTGSLATPDDTGADTDTDTENRGTLTLPGLQVRSLQSEAGPARDATEPSPGLADPNPGSRLQARASAFTDAPDRPLMTLEGVVVLSAMGDAISKSVFDGGTQITLVEFASDSATINNADGPMVVLYYRLDPDLKPDQEFELRLDAADTFVVDPFGNPMELELKPGRLRIEESDGRCSY